jgi:serine/threonine protein kinase
LGIDKLREILNGVVAGIIPQGTVPSNSQISQLQDFYVKYGPQLHIAWYVDPKSTEGNVVHGYKIVKNIGRGAFGNVYEAYDNSDNKYAIKLLLPEVKDKVQYLSCFRRGIRSMNILKEKNIEGMVKIHASYEVPASIIMDYVEGSTLREAIDKKLLFSPHKKLELVITIATIINFAHQLEERILHRDLKPENIILENFYYEEEYEPIKVKILDFDLSWHKGATELTIALGAMSQGFMAPEQANENFHDGCSRNTGVDVFSIGMLTYYIMMNENPAPNRHQFRYYKDDIVEYIQSNYRFKWICLSNYIAETIANATRHKQNQRISLDTFIRNIQIARNMIINDSIPNTHPLLLNEIAIKVDNQATITVSEFGRNVTLNSTSLAKKIDFKLIQKGNNVILEIIIEKLRREFDERQNLEKYLVTAKDKAISKVDKSIISTCKGEVLMSAIKLHLTAILEPFVSLKYIDNIAKNIQSVRSELEILHK